MMCFDGTGLEHFDLLFQNDLLFQFCFLGHYCIAYVV